MTSSRYPRQLRKKLSAYFDGEELRTLCFDLAIDYEGLPGRGKVARAREIVALLEREGRITQLVEYCAKLRPQVVWTFQSKLFISYKRHASTDYALAKYLHQTLKDKGHEVFVDETMRAGTAIA